MVHCESITVHLVRIVSYLFVDYDNAIVKVNATDRFGEGITLKMIFFRMVRIDLVDYIFGPFDRRSYDVRSLNCLLEKHLRGHRKNCK